VPFTRTPDITEELHEQLTKKHWSWMRPLPSWFMPSLYGVWMRPDGNFIQVIQRGMAEQTLKRYVPMPEEVRQGATLPGVTPSPTQWALQHGYVWFDFYQPWGGPQYRLDPWMMRYLTVRVAATTLTSMANRNRILRVLEWYYAFFHKHIRFKIEVLTERSGLLSWMGSEVGSPSFAILKLVEGGEYAQDSAKPVIP
jgi:hypothetical protein